MDDLFSRLLEAIAETERTRHEVHRETCQALPLFNQVTYPCDCGEPDRIRRRCAADRKIVEQVTRLNEGPRAEAWSFASRVAGLVVAHEIVAYLAEGYGLSDHQEGEE